LIFQEASLAKRSKKQEESDKFRAAVHQLRTLGEIFRDWEADWLDSEARRSDGYVPSDKERIILNQIRAAAQMFEGYNGITVPNLIGIVYRYRADLDYEDECFVTRLCEKSPRALPVRQLCHLVNLARETEIIGRDEVVDEAFAETKAKDEGLYEVPEYVPYRAA
jgi:hypothetical protein